MYLFQELNIMELGFAKDKFIQFPTGQVPVGHESCGTVWTSPWQNQFHDIEFLEEAFSDITVLNFKVFKKYIFCQFGKNLWNQLSLQAEETGEVGVIFCNKLGNFRNLGKFPRFLWPFYNFLEIPTKWGTFMGRKQKIISKPLCFFLKTHKLGNFSL